MKTWTGWRRSRLAAAVAGGAAAACAALLLLLLLPGSGGPGQRRREGQGPGSDEKLRQLRALPYLTHSPGKDGRGGSGVVRHVEGHAHPGLTILYALDPGNNITDSYVIDLPGRVVHRERRETGITFPGEVIGCAGFVRYFPDENELAWHGEGGEQLWRKGIRPHHEITCSAEGNLLVDFREEHEHRGRKVEFDGFVEIAPDGTERSRWSTFERLAEIRRRHPTSPLDAPGELAPEEPMVSFDYHHQNSIQALPDNPLGRADPRFRAGNLLVSLRNVDLILILDRDSRAIVWSWGPGEILRQHMPRMLPGGNILLFDNGLAGRRKHSRVIEVSPSTREIVWEYRGSPPESFFCHWVGSVQRLPGGNTLIGDGASGRALEVTPAGEVVWEWLNPERNERGERRVFYRAFRVPVELVRKYERLLKRGP